MRQQEASEQPKPPASSVGVGLDAIDWRAKAGERRLKEMEKNKETEFPALAADRYNTTPVCIGELPELTCIFLGLSDLGLISHQPQWHRT